MFFLQKEISFVVASSDQEVANNEGIQFHAAKNLAAPYLPCLGSETDPLSDYKSLGSQKLELTALSIAGGPKPEAKESSNMSTTISSGAVETANGIRPCLVCGVSVTSNGSAQIRTLENVWASSADLAPASSLVRAMNSVNSAASDSLDIMKVADRCTPTRSHYLILYDFYHKLDVSLSTKPDKAKDPKTKKTLSGTGTSASSNNGRQETLYQELFLSKFLYEVPVIEDVIEDVVIEDVDEMVIGAHLDALTASSSNGIHCSTPYNIAVAPTSSFPFDANFNPINSSDQFASTSDIAGLNKKTIDLMKGLKTDPVVIQTICIDAPDCQRVTYAVPSRDGRHFYVALCPGPDIALTDPPPASNANQMDIDEDSEFLPSKSYMYWDQNELESSKLINGEVHNNPSKGEGALLLVYAFDLTGKVVKLVPEPVAKRELPISQVPIEHVLLPLQEKNRSRSMSSSSVTVNPTSFTEGPKGQIALVCRDGIVRLLDLGTLKTVSEARLDGSKFISATYCNSESIEFGF